MNNFDAELFARTVRRARKSQGRSIVDTARKLGLSRAGYTRIENGERQPGVDVLYAISVFFGLSTETFRKAAWNETEYPLKDESVLECKACGVKTTWEEARQLGAWTGACLACKSNG